MAAGTIYRKTERGVAEVRDRKLKLSPRVRTMLILVDGALPESQLQEDAGRVGAPPDFLQQLEAAGLIERAEGAAPAPRPDEAPKADAAAAPADAFARFREAKDFMNTTIVDALGIKSFLFTMKLERAADLADLRDLVGAFRLAIARAEGDAKADVMAARLKDLLG